VPNAKVAMCMQSTMADHPMCVAMRPKPAPTPARTSALDAKDPRVTSGSDRARDSQLWTKSYEDSALTKAAMQPTEKERAAANCAYAKQIGDTILAGRFGCEAGK